MIEQQDLAAQEAAQNEATPVHPEQAQEAPAQAEAQHEPENMGELLDQYGSTVRLRKGQILTGTVVGKNDAGWLVDVGFKCEGVLPEKEYTSHKLIETGPEPKPGDTIEVEVVQVRDGEEAQLSLSRWRHEFDKRWDALEASVYGETAFNSADAAHLHDRAVCLNLCLQSVPAFVELVPPPAQ